MAAAEPPATRPRAVRHAPPLLQRRVSLCETLDRVLNKGAVITGDIVISVADIDLIYVGLNLVVTSVETMNRQRPGAPRAAVAISPGPGLAPQIEGAPA
jgi:hypothetical protein